MKPRRARARARPRLVPLPGGSPGGMAARSDLLGWVQPGACLPVEQHACQLLQQLKAMLDERLLTDVLLLVECGGSFPCHRNVLAAVSPYFRSMFTNGLTESSQREVSILGVEVEAMQLVLDFAYTSRANLTESNVQGAFAAANLFQIPGLLSLTAAFMASRLDAQNVVGVFAFADAHHHAELRAAACGFIRRWYPAVAREREFGGLSRAQLEELLLSDDLNVEREEQVYESVVAWAGRDPGRLSELPGVFARCLRLSLMDAEYVRALPAALSRALCPDGAAASADANAEAQASRPRLGMTATEMVICFEAAHKHSARKRMVICLDPVTHDVYRLSRLPGDLREAGLLVTPDNDLLVAGGYRPGSNEAAVDHRAEAECWRYEHSSDQWRVCGTLVRARIRCQLAHCRGATYAVGGHVYEGDGRNALKSVERYSERDEVWTSVSPMPVAMEYHSVAAALGRIYVLQGDVFLAYQAEHDHWEYLTPMTVPRLQSHALVCGDWLYCVGGALSSAAAAAAAAAAASGGGSDGGDDAGGPCEGSRRRTLTVERYSLRNNVWERRSELPLDPGASPYARPVALGGRLHMFVRQTQVLLEELVFSMCRRYSLFANEDETDTWREVYTAPERLWDLGRHFECVAAKMYPQCLHKML
ncbi:kelch repeat and BTB domain-containing protein 8 isoform X1 [Lethenteron reissneri]|uniref:kelch repeat and BTB domain-containing protein 8 isoform X1 n=2 Tax=Lethenteron reissneri TaxID=7753 RepID=UPI002AB60515|nr:kelch repeat and BTB domain-containing protein 8 isoform X1 [Lethenteron reissneri]